MKTKITVLLLIAAFSLASCDITEISTETDSGLMTDANYEQTSQNPQNKSAQKNQTEASTDIVKTKSYDSTISDDPRAYQEHIRKANVTIRKISAEMAEKNWERITCFHYVPNDYCEYEEYKIDFQDFRDLYIESSENPGDYYYTIIGSIPGRGGKFSQEPLLVVSIVSFDEENPDGVIRSILYNTVSGFTYEEPWKHPDGNVICDAYNALLWDGIYSPM